MNVSEEERAQLHMALDYLLNTRGGLERIAPEELRAGGQWRAAWSGPRGEFVRAASNFLRQVLGEKLHAAELSILLDTPLAEPSDDAGILATIANTLRSF